LITGQHTLFVSNLARSLSSFFRDLRQNHSFFADIQHRGQVLASFGRQHSPFYLTRLHFTTALQLVDPAQPSARISNKYSISISTVRLILVKIDSHRKWLIMAIAMIVSAG
jgi:hypothetical protein